MSKEDATEETQCLNLTSGHNSLSYRLNKYVKKHYERILVSVNHLFPYHIFLIKLKLANILQFFISTLFPIRNLLHFTQGP